MALCHQGDCVLTLTVPHSHILIWLSSWLQAFINRLHTSGQRFVPILDPFIHLAPGYAAYQNGVEADAFIKDVSGKPYIGQVSFDGHLSMMLCAGGKRVCSFL